MFCGKISAEKYEKGAYMQGGKLKKAYRGTAGKAVELLAEMNIQAAANNPEDLARKISKISGKKLKKSGASYFMRFVVEWVATRDSAAAIQIYAPKAGKLDKWEQSPEFLKSKEWKALRYQALVAHGGRCQCCGACAAEGARLNVDHIFPRSTHPALALDINNLQVLCGTCNEGKSNVDTTDWRTAVKH